MTSLLDEIEGSPRVVDAVLTGDLSEGERLSGVEFVRCTFRDAGWAGAELAGLRFERCAIERVDLSRVVMPDSVLDDCIFTGCRALATSWSTMRAPVIAPDPSTWVDCRLSMGSFAGLDLTGARFERCDLTEVDFDGANLRDVVVDDCSLARARFVRADLRGADLRMARDYVIDGRETQVRGLRVDPVGGLGLLAPFGVDVE